MRISDWSSDVCSSDLILLVPVAGRRQRIAAAADLHGRRRAEIGARRHRRDMAGVEDVGPGTGGPSAARADIGHHRRSEEHTSELQSLMRISYAVFCLKKKKIQEKTAYHEITDKPSS